ncbi:hypothetical protein F5I97DRAFT_1874306 [Phlebopus sp. FC_14]|nr:hypothetical protein F5I97DRAFT_1874306 [Phlebopus sp. FC_14]
MSTRRESLFPATSIGRAQGATIVRSASRESLIAHPLLSPGSSLPPSSPTPTPDGSAHSSNAKYVPYTPRQRQATATTATVAQPPVSVPPQLSQSQGGAANKLQLVNLKSAAQGIGLDVGSVGWAILEKLSYEGDTTGEWAEIWTAITKGKASLLLPLEQALGQEKITPEFVQDHIIVCDVTSRDDAAVITMSGLRGRLVTDVLTFRSTLSPSTKQFQDLFTVASSRASLLAALPPLPSYPSESSYPTFTVPTFSSSLPLPSRSSKPPLPPRPNIRPASVQTSSRLSMPFASLFGQKPSTPPTSTTPLPPATGTTVSSSSPTDTIEAPIEVSVFCIDIAVSRRDVSREIVGALKGEIAVLLNDHPPWVVERVQNFASPLFPFVKEPSGKKKRDDVVVVVGGNSSPSRTSYVVNAAQDAPEGLALRFQDFYAAFEAELRSHRREPKEGLTSEECSNDHQGDNEDDEALIRDALETVEYTLSTLFYDRLFLPFNSDDASHDEALSSRIAALNMLDLGLEHLDVDVGNAGHESLDAVVRDCGETLSQLDLASRSPRDKITVLVSAHKVVVDGLSKVPPIRLRDSDDGSRLPLAPAASTEANDVLDVPTVSSPVDIPGVVATDLREDKEYPSHSPSAHSVSPVRPRPRSLSPLNGLAPPSISTPVSGDVLLPFIIFSAVKANPPRLVSHLLFTQRFRNQSFGGEESYCLINLMAVAEFLENVDLGVLGLKESENKVINTADLSPIPVLRSGVTPDSPAAVLNGVPGSFRGRMEQGVDAIAGSANKVISGVVDSSFGVLRAFLPGQNNNNANSGGGVPKVGSVDSNNNDASSAGTPGSGSRPGLGLLRRESGSLIASLTASLPGQGQKARDDAAAAQRELVEVSSSRPASVKSCKDDRGSIISRKTDEDSSSDDDDDEESEEDGDNEDEEAEEEVHDTRSIKSFESMMGSSKVKKRRRRTIPSARRSLTDRLAHMPGLSKFSQNDASTKIQPDQLSQLPLSIRFPPPNRRFLECTEQDIKVSEVGELLREYQRLVECVRSIGAFDE